MERKKSQIMFNFLPNDTFDHAQNGTIGKVTHLDGDEDVNTEDFPMKYILDRVRATMEEWEEKPDFRAGRVNLKSPGDVNYEIFPPVFECSNCDTVNRLEGQDIEGFGKGRTDQGTCKQCGNGLRDHEQQQFVMVCKCGSIEPLWVPENKGCSHQTVKLVRNGSRLQEAEWTCNKCGKVIGDMLDFAPKCPICSDDGSDGETVDKKIKVHSSSTTFYPQTTQFVNVQDENIDLIRENQDYRIRTIVDYLKDKDSTATPKDELEEQAERTLELLDDESKKEELRQKVNQKLDERDKSEEELREFLERNLDSTQLRVISEQLFEYSSTTSDNTFSTSLDELHEEARERVDLRAGQIGKYKEKRDEMNLSDVRLLENFPITSAVFGYTRISPFPEDKVRVNSFTNENGNNEIFVQTTNAEAIMITLNEDKVKQWLIENDIGGEIPDDKFREWLMVQMAPIDRDRTYPYFEEIEGDREVARAVLNLIHTYSHTLVRAIDGLSGYSRNSLSEYTLPFALSFVVYKRSDTDFNLGSMFTLIEDQFSDLMRYVDEECEECIYSPVCEEEENSSCEGCLFLPNISCQHGNRNMSRSTLYGGEFYGDRIEGFLDV